MTSGEPVSTHQPLVSVVTPSYNRAHFLRTCLQSVCAQDYPNIEHIVVDGGSDDETVDVLREYESRYPLRWVSEPDQGMYHAVNKGLAMARGDVLCYLNTDDAYLPWSVSAAVQELSRGAGAVFGDLLVAKQGQGCDVSYVQFYRPFTMGHYTWSRTIGQPTVFWNASLYTEIGGFDTSFKLIADCEYWLRMGAHGAAPMKIDEVLAVQVDHDDTLRETRSELLRQEFKMLRQRYATYSEQPRWPQLERIKSSVAWRASNAMLVTSFLLGIPRKRWPRFTGYLRDQGIRLHASYALLGALPGLLLAKRGLSLLDATELLRTLSSRRASC